MSVLRRAVAMEEIRTWRIVAQQKCSGGANLFLAPQFAMWELRCMKSPVRTINTLRPTEVARAVQVSVSHASELINGRKSPSLSVAVKIERAFGIAPSAWLEPRTDRAA